MPFGAAVALLYGKATLEEYTREAFRSPQVNDMMGRVRCIEVPELEKDFPKKWPALVIIKTTRGQEFTVKIDYPKGDPENPLSQDELIQKFKGLTQAVFSAERRDRIIDMVQAVETINSLKALSELLLKDKN